MSAVNETMALAMAQKGFQVKRFDTAPRSLQRTPGVRLARLVRFMRAGSAALAFSLRHTGAAVYYSLSGGWGLLYEAASIGATRLVRGRVVLHHHSFRYLDAPFWPMALLVWTAGTGAMHIVLGPAMAWKLRQRYPTVRHVLELSNALFVAEAPVQPSRPLGKVGYLANLNPGKGIAEVMQTIARSHTAGLPLQFVVAGPFEDPRGEIAFRAWATTMPNLEYRGAVYGTDKDNFYADIDAFIFPTRYRHEAEPLVVLEALARGRPVIAYGRGCIPELLAGGVGQAVAPDADFAGSAVERLMRWRSDRGEFTEQAERARRRFMELRSKSQVNARRLFALFAGAKSMGPEVDSVAELSSRGL
jgi:glycosyltransferase involved in cell wall biosynthesis